jgi:hypothetical protein
MIETPRTAVSVRAAASAAERGAQPAVQQHPERESCGHEAPGEGGEARRTDSETVVERDEGDGAAAEHGGVRARRSPGC